MLTEIWRVISLELKEKEIKVTLQQEPPRSSLLFLYVPREERQSYQLGGTFGISITPTSLSADQAGKIELLSPLEAGQR
jgi:hypothetical protein